MVKRIHGLDRGPQVPPDFGAEHMLTPAPFAAGDEVRCTKVRQEIYIGVLGVSTDGWLVGQVITFGMLNGRDSFGVDLGELVELRIDRVQAVLRGTTVRRNEETCEAPKRLLQAAH